MADEILLALCMFPGAETAKRIAEQLVDEHLVACANILPAVESIYRWEDKLEHASETIAFFKTTQDCFGAFRKRLKALHPYDVPEIIALRVADGLPEYLRWASDACSC